MIYECVYKIIKKDEESRDVYSLSLHLLIVLIYGMRSLMLIVLTLPLAILVLAQDDPKKDSLLDVLPVMEDDSTRIMLFLQVSDIYATVDLDSALLYIHKAQDLANDKGLTPCHRYVNPAF